ncbi:SAM-dependent methyltransferase, partial [Enterococcus faecalis]
LSVVHRSHRFLDILHAMDNANISQKKARFVYPKPGKEANVLLIEGIKQAKKDGFRVLPPLFTYNEKNEYQAEVKAMLYGV